MEMQHLRYFAALAAELHFTRAARRAAVSQQALSAAVRELEAEVGVQLVERTTRRVALTPAGAHFAQEAEATLVRLRAAVAETRARGNHGRLRLVYPGRLRDQPHAALGLFQRRHPEVVTSLRLLASHEQTRAVLDGEADVGFVVPPLDEPDLAYRRLVDETLVAALPASHPLSRRRRLSLGALAAETFILYPSRRKRAMVGFVRGACAAAGFTPDVRHEAPDEGALVELVAEGLGVGLVSSATAARARAGVRFRPLLEAPTLELGAVFRPADAPRLACLFQAFEDTLPTAMTSRTSRGRRPEPGAKHGCPLHVR